MGKPSLKFFKLFTRLFNRYEIAVRMCLGVLNGVQTHPATDFDIERVSNVIQLDAMGGARHMIDAKGSLFE